jgi:prepilin-type N-terminal cleavage/methylation domain-containing protein
VSQKGVSIVEVLVSLAIIAIVFVVLANTQLGNLRITRDSQQASEATQIAIATLERIKAGVTTPAGFSAALNGGGTRACEAEVDSRFTVNCELRRAGANHGREGMLLAQVTVTGPTSVTMAEFLSCMDVVPAPSFDDPAPCPASWRP